MWYESKNKLVYLLLFAGIVISYSRYMCRADNIFSKNPKSKNKSKPRLYIARPEANSTEMVGVDSDTTLRAILSETSDANLPAEAKYNLVVATHGWLENKPWPQDLVLVIKNRVTSQGWLFGWCDWRAKSVTINPADAAKHGRNLVGPQLGRDIVQLSKNWGHIHLIGHSSGAWVINEAAKIIAKETDAVIHMTFLDAYVPILWKESHLGDFHNDPNVVFWADHYFTRDLTFTVTENILSNAHNVDLTKVDPGLNDHELPFYWYYGTVAGQYQTGEKYDGKKLFYSFGTIDYGFTRSLEAGQKNWETSTALSIGNRPIKVKGPQKPFELPFQKQIELPFKILFEKNEE